MNIKVRGKEIDLKDFMERFLFISDKEGRLVNLKFNYAQCRVYEKMCEMNSRGEPIMIDILKARQMGMSTFIAGVFFTEAMFNANCNYVVVADIQEHAQGIFDKYVMFYKYLNHWNPKLECEIERWENEKGTKHPSDLRPTLETQRQGKVMKTKEGNSSIRVISSDDASGRSMTLQGFHASEVAFWAKPSATFTSLNQTVSMTNPNAMIFIETTANGFNDYKTMWDRDAGGDTGRTALFIPWFRHDEYRMRKGNMPSKMPVMEGWIYDKLKAHPEITDDQILWFWRMYRQQAGKEDALQEYPFDPMDAFRTSGMSVFDMEALGKRKNETLELPRETGRFDCETKYSEDGRSIALSNIEFTKYGNEWKVYQRPIEGEPYVIVCDPTKGFNTDFSAIQVLNNRTGKQVACYRSDKDDLDEVAKQLVCAGYWYNTALISSENNTGPNILDFASKCKYPKIYMEQAQTYENINQSIGVSLGHNTNRGNREAMIGDLRMAFRSNPSMIVDYETLTEMETFQLQRTRSGTGYKSAPASDADHDDLVMALVPFWRVRTQQSFASSDENKSLGSTRPKTFYELKNEVEANNRKARDNSQVSTDYDGIRW